MTVKIANFLLDSDLFLRSFLAIVELSNTDATNFDFF